MNYLVTGGAGFIGSYLVDRLIKDGHSVSVIDDLSTGKLQNLNAKSTFYKLKIETRKIEEVFIKEKEARLGIDYIFHLAAQIDVRKSLANPILDITSNIIGTVNLLNLAIKYKVRKFIFASSGGVMYGNTDKPAKETDKVNPESPYGIDKLTGENYIKLYSSIYGLNYTILRYANVYGPRQDPFGEAGVCAIFAENMLNKKGGTSHKSILYGFGKMTRDYVYVDDVTGANILSLKKGNNQTLNIGTGIETTVNKLFSTMKEITGYSLSPIYKPKRKGEVDRNYLNPEKAKKVLGWAPKIELKQGLKKIIEWMR